MNPNASTNKAEFFAVTAAYFFERPQLLKDKHPQLYEILNEIFETA
ncbi:MAG: zinc-dependent peptidase [Ferruginibacter sp.]